jgi:cytochrome c
MIRIAVASLAVCLSLFAAGAARAEGDAASGEKLFRQCKSCHATEAGKNRVGPSLFGVVGKKAGSAEEFKGYSEGLKAAGFSWDDAKLDAYLTNPKAVIADSKMAFAGIAEAADREHVVAYLKTLK